jgi:hypothetical protein
VLSIATDFKLILNVKLELSDQLTPFDGWDSPKAYKKELEENSGELFIYVVDYERDRKSVV